MNKLILKGVHVIRERPLIDTMGGKIPKNETNKNGFTNFFLYKQFLTLSL